ncbi:MAG: protein phosphatase 2C domain-containing protein, partial [Anaerolineae bacterium]
VLVDKESEEIVEDESATFSTTEPLVDEERTLRHSGSFEVAWLTDTGRVRPHNEDGIFVFMGEQQSSDALPPFGLFVLADGMGGHKAGEAASALASKVVVGYLISEIYQPLLNGSVHTATQPSLTEVMATALAKANQVVSRTLPGSGTTLTCGLVLGMRLFIGHVGDSRAYLRRAGRAPELLTTDHSVVGQLVESGQLSPEEALVHPQRNMLYRAVGQGGALEVDVLTQALQDGDELLFCSDGLWGFLCDDEMWSIIDEAPSLEYACAQLVAEANAAGGNDNISVILVKTEQEWA